MSPMCLKHQVLTPKKRLDGLLVQLSTDVYQLNLFLLQILFYCTHDIRWGR